MGRIGQPEKIARGLLSMKISKRSGIAIFSLTGLALAMIIVMHQNRGPDADPQQELIKKMISCVVILITCLVFAKWYDKFTTLPVYFIQQRAVNGDLAKTGVVHRMAGS